MIIRRTCRFLAKISTVVHSTCLLQLLVFYHSNPICMACFIIKGKCL